MQKTNNKKTNRPKTSVGERSQTIYIGNLRYNFDEKAVMGLFAKFGKVKNVNLVKENGTDKSKGIAFVDMYKAASATLAVKNLNGRVVSGRTLKVSIAIEGEQKFYRCDDLSKTAAKKQGLDPENEKSIILKKKARRRRGLDELFQNIGKK